MGIAKIRFATGCCINCESAVSPRGIPAGQYGEPGFRQLAPCISRRKKLFRAAAAPVLRESGTGRKSLWLIAAKFMADENEDAPGKHTRTHTRAHASTHPSEHYQIGTRDRERAKARIKEEACTYKGRKENRETREVRNRSAVEKKYPMNS